MPNKTSFQSMSASDRYDLLRAIAIKNRREPFIFPGLFLGVAALCVKTSSMREGRGGKK